MKFRVKSTLKYSVQRMTPTKAVRIALLVISDALILNIASFLALWVRFEFHFEQLVRETEYLNNILRFAPYYTAFGLIVFALFKLYTSLWQFASIDEFLKIILACLGCRWIGCISLHRFWNDSHFFAFMYIMYSQLIIGQ